ncbi:hypothetical protein V8E52_001546 [Russula decolorans]
MFASGFVTLFFVALVAVNVVGYPVPMPIRRALAQRGPAPFEPIKAYINRGYVRLSPLVASWSLNICLRLTVELPSARTPTPTPFRSKCLPKLKRPDGQVVPYVKRQADSNINTIPEEQPTKAPNGQIVPYVKRQADSNINTIPEEQPTKAPNGQIVPYVKRQVDSNINTIPEEQPTKAPNGQIVPYVKR